MRALALMLLLTSPAAAQIGPDLYHAEALVTGREMATRIDGAAAGLRDVLVKRTGNPAMLTDARIGAIDPIVPIQDYYYLDRMSDLPHHDEQGTRERPYFLTLAFDPARIDALLAALGERPWLTRPRLQIRLSIRDASGVTYPLTADGDDDERHRQGLAAAARKFGMRLALRSEKAAADPKLSDALLIEGEIIWSDADFGWVGKWRAGDTTWGIKGVSFDAAYRNLVLGAMAIASGHQLPVQAAQ